MRNAGPLLLVLPALVFVYGLLWFLRHPPQGRPTGYGDRISDATGFDDPDTVPGFAGELGLDGGSRITVHLTPLHAAPERQDFDAAVLRRRLGLDAGWPWRLELRHLGPADGLAVTVGSAYVDDGGGLALAPLVPDTGAPPEAGELDGPVDPLRSLFATGEVLVGPERSIQRVLWGRPPTPGGAGDGVRARVEVGGTAWEVSLVQVELGVPSLPRSVARVEVDEDGVRGGAEGR